MILADNQYQVPALQFGNLRVSLEVVRIVQKEAMRWKKEVGLAT
jgi:hypothetical protein